MLNAETFGKRIFLPNFLFGLKCKSRKTKRIHLVTFIVLLFIGIGILVGYSKLKKLFRGQESTERVENQNDFVDVESSPVISDKTIISESKKVQLYEERGEASRFIDAEITKDGDIVMTGQDLGKITEEFWGDSDYEFFVYIPASYKDDVYRVLLEKLSKDYPEAVNKLDKFRLTEDAVLALIEKLYAGNPKAVDDFKDYMRSQGIPAEFDSWA